MVRRPWPARLGTDFRKDSGCFIADPHGAEFGYCTRKRSPVLPAFDIGEHCRVKNDQRHVARSLCGKLSQISAQISPNDTRRVLTLNCQRSAKVLQPVGFSWPDQGFEPGYLVIIVEIDWVRIEPRSPAYLDPTDRKRRPRARSAG